MAAGGAFDKRKEYRRSAAAVNRQLQAERND
jgi:hypothetical protein